jgi:hypothetical protein
MSASPRAFPGSPPRELAVVPEEFQISEAFGWAPAVWGSVLLILSGLQFVERPEWSKPLWYGMAALFAMGGLALVRYEFTRRRRPVVLVPFPGAPGGPQVALYIRGTLDCLFPSTETRFFIRHPVNTWGSIISLTFLSAMFVMFQLPGGKISLTLQERALLGLAAALSIALLSSVIRSRLFCDQVILPSQGRRSRWILIRKKQVKRIFQ